MKKGTEYFKGTVLQKIRRDFWESFFEKMLTKNIKSNFFQGCGSGFSDFVDPDP
jgi:hypothetical protein